MPCEENSPVVGIIMGSESDMPAMEPCMKQLDEFGVPYEVKVASAHRKPAEVHEWASTAHERGIRVIVAAAGKAAHLGGVVAAYTPNPVITVPMKTSDLGGLDSLLSMVQMPSACRWRAWPSTARRTPPSSPCRSSAPAATAPARKSSTSSRAWPTRKQNRAHAFRTSAVLVPNAPYASACGAYNFLNIMQHFPRRRHVRYKEAVSG